VFFFFSYEKLARRESSTVNNTIPTVPMRKGDFSALAGPIYDPQTYDPATRIRQAFPGNLIPANRIDPVAKQLIDFCLLSRICGEILAPAVVPSCDKGQFP